MGIYNPPLYYEVAFSFFNSKQQVNYERIIKKFSRIRVRSFLDIACGPSLQLRGVAKRGYRAIGLDSSPEMLKYLRQRARDEGVRIETIKADMRNFRLKRKVDFAFIMMGSLGIESNDQFLRNLSSVAYSLKVGGLYFIQNKAVDWTREADQSWTMKRCGIRVKTRFTTRWKGNLNHCLHHLPITNSSPQPHLHAVRTRV